MALTLVTSDLIGGLDYSKLTGTVPTWNQNTTGSAATLTTARNIGGVSFNGSAAINLPGVNAAGNQNTSGNAGTVTNGVYTVGNQTIGGTKTFSSATTFQLSALTNPSGVDANTVLTIKNNGWSGITMLSSAAAGSFLTFGDADAGFRGRIQYLQGSTDAMVFETAASEKMRITSDGNVGIGTASPGAKLHNYSTATTNVFITGYGTAAQNNWQAQNAFFVKTDNGILISKENANNNTNRLFNFYNNASAEAEMYMYRGGSTSYVKLDTNGDSYLNGGKVGIGTTSPSTKLDVQGATGTRNYNTTSAQSSSIYETSRYYSAAGNATTNVAIVTTTAFPTIGGGGYIMVEVSASGYGSGGSNGLVFSWIGGGYGGHFGTPGSLSYHPVQIIADTHHSSCNVSVYYPNYNNVGITIVNSSGTGMAGVMRVKVTTTY